MPQCDTCSQPSPPHAQCRAGGLSGVLQQLQGYFPEDAGNSKEPTLPPPEFAERLKRKTKMPGRFPTERTVPNGPRRKSRDHSRPLQKSLLLHQIQIEPHEDACGLCSDGRAGGVNGAILVALNQSFSVGPLHGNFRPFANFTAVGELA